MPPWKTQETGKSKIRKSCRHVATIEKRLDRKAATAGFAPRVPIRANSVGGGIKKKKQGASQ